jgi:hypothetical protein
VRWAEYGQQLWRIRLSSTTHVKRFRRLYKLWVLDEVIVVAGACFGVADS